MRDAPKVTALSRWPRLAALNYLSNLPGKSKRDLAQIALLGGPVLGGLIATLVSKLGPAQRLLDEIGLPAKPTAFVLFLALGAAGGAAMARWAARLAAPRFLAAQPVPGHIRRAARRQMRVPLIVVVALALAAIGGGVAWLGGVAQTGTLFVLPSFLGLALGTVGVEIAERRPGQGRRAYVTTQDAAPAFGPLDRLRRGRFGLWWRHQGREGRRSGRAGPVLARAVIALGAVLLGALALVQHIPWAWGALGWLVAGGFLLRELNLSGLAARVLATQPVGFWRAMVAGTVSPLLSAVLVYLLIGGLGAALGLVSLPMLVSGAIGFLGIGLYYACILAFTRGSRRLAVLIAGLVLFLCLSNSDYLREATPLVPAATAAYLLLAARRNALRPLKGY